MIKGIGLDIMLISRMQDSLKKRPELTNKVFSDEERLYMESRADMARSAAGLFAAKEAVLKAMGHGIGHIPLRDICFTHDERGAPVLAMPVAGRMLVSITHMGDTAAAVAVWEEQAQAPERR